MKKIFMPLAFISPLSFAGIPTIDVANLMENDVKPLVWALDELKAIGSNVDDLEIIDFTFPCKVVYQSKSDKSVLVHVPSAFVEPVKAGSLCENPVNINPDVQTNGWAYEEIYKVDTRKVKVIDITYPCKIVYQALDNLEVKLFVPESSKTNEACIKKPLPLSEAEQKRQKELTEKMDEVRAKNRNAQVANSPVIFSVLLCAAAFLIFILFLSRRSDESKTDSSKDE